MEYDAIGQLRQKRDFRNYVTRYLYDVRGRMTAKVPDAALNEASVTYAYSGENFRTATRNAKARLRRRGLPTMPQAIAFRR